MERPSSYSGYFHYQPNESPCAGTGDNKNNEGEKASRYAYRNALLYKRMAHLSVYQKHEMGKEVMTARLTQRRW